MHVFASSVVITDVILLLKNLAACIMLYCVKIILCYVILLHCIGLHHCIVPFAFLSYMKENNQELEINNW